MDVDRPENMIHTPNREGGRGEGRKSRGGCIRGFRSTLLKQPAINDIEPLTGTPYSDGIVRHAHAVSDFYMRMLQNCMLGINGWRDRMMKEEVNEMIAEKRWGERLSGKRMQYIGV